MPDRGPGTGTNYEKGKWNTTFPSEIPTGKTGPLFLGIFQWDEPTKRVPFTAEPEIPEILTKWKAPTISSSSFQSYVAVSRPYLLTPTGSQ